jgi:hypothetical protein
MSKVVPYNSEEEAVEAMTVWVEEGKEHYVNLDHDPDAISPEDRKWFVTFYVQADANE